MVDTRARASAGATRAPRSGVRFAVLAGVALVAAVAVLLWQVPFDPSRRGFWLAIDLRLVSIVTIIVVACAQGVATVLFHTATSNRILTPSIMGFDALYVVIQTALVFYWGAGALTVGEGLIRVAVQSLIMIGFATLLYSWLFAGRRGNLHIMLLVGIVLGTGFASLSTVMQRLLTPSEFDILSARLFGNLSNADPNYLPWAALIVAAVVAVVATLRHRLDVLALGSETATSLGLHYKRDIVIVLMLVAVLISVSTTLVGPMTFFGFIVATLAYQLSGSSRHGIVLPFAILLGIATLLVSYFVLRHMFAAAGMLTVILEFGGGLFFLIYLLRKGRL